MEKVSYIREYREISAIFQRLFSPFPSPLPQTLLVFSGSGNIRFIIQYIQDGGHYTPRFKGRDEKSQNTTSSLLICHNFVIPFLSRDIQHSHILKTRFIVDDLCDYFTHYHIFGVKFECTEWPKHAAQSAVFGEACHLPKPYLFFVYIKFLFYFWNSKTS